jgi:hypothetical protein
VRTAKEKKIKISFAWIWAHVGNTGNELTDNLAKAAAVSHQSISYDLIPVSYVKRLVYQKNINIWNQRWISSETGSETQKYFPTVYHRLQAKKFFRTSYYMTQFITNSSVDMGFLRQYEFVLPKSM